MGGKEKRRNERAEHKSPSSGELISISKLLTLDCNLGTAARGPRNYARGTNIRPDGRNFVGQIKRRSFHVYRAGAYVEEIETDAA